MTVQISALPTIPSRSDAPTTFSRNADTFLAALPTFRTEANALAIEVNANTTACSAYSAAASASAASALTSQTNANASATAAASAGNAPSWVSGTTYTAGSSIVYSPITFLSYRCKVTGVSIVDPSADSVTWACINGTNWATITAAYTAKAGEYLFVNTTSSAYTITLPASPYLGSTITFADLASTFNTNPLTLGRNGKNIMGLAEDMIVYNSNITFTIVYSGASYGWRLVL